MNPIRKDLTLSQQWHSMTPTQQKAVAGLGAIEVVLTVTAIGDLLHRPSEEVRGPKFLWLLSCFVQPVGPLAYLKFGRRPTTRG